MKKIKKNEQFGEFVVVSTFPVCQSTLPTMLAGYSIDHIIRVDVCRLRASNTAIIHSRLNLRLF